MLRFTPAASTTPSASAATSQHHQHHRQQAAAAAKVGEGNTYGVHDTLRAGIRTVRSEVIQGHPQESHQMQVSLDRRG